jgi:nitroimidazol reductase NimA-like FMN-containing flavoprotein (pyridoxamine 5'-phosphate oxidase superfamily)
MFQEMRRQDRGLNRPETREILANGRFGVLSMNSGDDYAYGVPFSYVYLQNSIYLHCALEGKKLRHIRRDNRVSFCVVQGAGPFFKLPDTFSMKYKSAMVFGKIYEVDNAQEKLQGLIALVEKYYCDDPEHVARGRVKTANSLDKTAVLRIDIDHLTGKVRREKGTG